MVKVVRTSQMRPPWVPPSTDHYLPIAAQYPTTKFKIDNETAGNRWKKYTERHKDASVDHNFPMQKPSPGAVVNRQAIRCMTSSGLESMFGKRQSHGR